MKVKRPGFIYCFSHPMLTLALGENVYKLGRTCSVNSRARSAVTFMSVEMECIYKDKVCHDIDAENLLFEMLEDFRIRPDREFFQIELNYIKRIMKSVVTEINSREYRDNSKSTIKEKLIPCVISNKKIKLCLRCGYKSSQSKVARHMFQRKGKPCKAIYLNIDYEEMIANYPKYHEVIYETIANDTIPKNSKKFVCKGCQRSYSQRSGLSRHIKECDASRLDNKINKLIQSMSREINTLRSLNSEQ